MKKTITILAAVMMVLSFAGMASALTAANCGGDPGYINSGCGDEQGTCAPFDFDDYSAWSRLVNGNLLTGYSYGENYCDKMNNRAVIAICDCIPDPFENVTSNQNNPLLLPNRYEIGMNILVDKKDGNGAVEGANWVYFVADAELADGVNVWTYSSQGVACSDYDNSEAITAGTFGGDFDLLLANGSSIILVNNVPQTSQLSTSTNCEAFDPWEKVVEIRNTPYTNSGYSITPEDDQFDASNWVIDIPAMNTDVTEVEAGWDVYVDICIYETTGSGDGICSDCEACCFTLFVGTLCCPDSESSADGTTLVFPYLGRTDGSWWNGMAVTNLSDEAATASVTLYENGDVWTGDVALEANGIAIIVPADLTLTTAGGDGVYGNERSYVVADVDADASGFAFMANTNDGTSMGYLAEKQ